MKNLNFDQKSFMLNIIGEFRNKPTEDSIRTTYNYLKRQLDRELKNDNFHVIQRKIEILQKCYDMFSDEGFRNIIRRGNLSAKQIAQKSAGRILGADKRKYDMSNKYLKGSVASKKGQYGELKMDMDFDTTKRDDTPEKFNNGTKTIYIRQSGELSYTSGFMVEKNKVKQYKIILQGNNTKEEYYVFSEGIDLEKMKIDSEYCSAVLDELLSENNIKLSESGHYIGSICDTKDDSKPLQVGDEREDGLYGDYEYQISENYKLVYDSQNLSAVMDYESERNRGEGR